MDSHPAQVQRINLWSVFEGESSLAGGAYVPTLVVGMYAPFGVVGVYHATICMPWAFIVALWHVEDPTTGAYIATTGVATYAPPANNHRGPRLTAVHIGGTIISVGIRFSELHCEKKALRPSVLSFIVALLGTSLSYIYSAAKPNTLAQSTTPSASTPSNGRATTW